MESILQSERDMAIAICSWYEVGNVTTSYFQGDILPYRIANVAMAICALVVAADPLTLRSGGLKDIFKGIFFLIGSQMSRSPW